MKFYQEITLLPNFEIDKNFLWSKLFTQIHLGLAEMQNDKSQSPIGISFPEYVIGKKFSVLGSKLRLFAENEAILAKFDTAKWLSRLSDYVHFTSIREVVPQKITGYAIYQRQQPKVNKERLARRYARRHNLDYETALNSEIELSVKSNNDAGYEKKLIRYCDLPDKIIPTPFVRLKSLGNGETFCLWIKKTLTPQSNSATFSTYGLSSNSTVPEFN